jgi:hypothetical protein
MKMIFTVLVTGLMTLGLTLLQSIFIIVPAFILSVLGVGQWVLTFLNGLGCQFGDNFTLWQWFAIIFGLKLIFGWMFSSTEKK